MDCIARVFTMNMGAAGGVCNVNVTQSQYAQQSLLDAVLFNRVTKKVIGIIVTQPNKSGLASVVVSGVVQVSVDADPSLRHKSRLYYDSATNECTFTENKTTVEVGHVMRIVRARTHNNATRARYCVTTRLSVIPQPHTA